MSGNATNLAEASTTRRGAVKSDAERNERERIAYHEAGHAVMTYCCRHTILRVSIVAAGNRLGALEVKRPKWIRPGVKISLWHKKQINGYVMILFAGISAEMKLRGKWEFHGSRLDRCYARKFASLLFGGRARRAYMPMMFRLTHEIIADPLVWPMVDEIAKILIARRRLSGSWAEEVCRRITPKGGAVFAAIEKEISECGLNAQSHILSQFNG
jgi:hypothetical protein